MLFLTDDLQSKWGFRDGQIFSDLLRDNMPEVEEKASEEFEKNVPGKEAFALYFSDFLLEIIVRKYILPKLIYKIILKRVVGHNPVRAKTIDGLEIDEYKVSHLFKLKPNYIEVENDVILEDARKLWNNRQYLEQIRNEFPDG